MRTRSATVLTMIALALTGSCQRNAQPDADTVAANNSASSADTGLVVAVERGPCYGTCPEYVVELFGDGRVSFRGAKNVGVVGVAGATVASAVVDSVRRLIAESEFATIDTAFVYGSAGCGQYVTDLPTIVVRARIASGVKTVRHELGCRGAPAIVLSIADRVDSLTGTQAWITGKSEGAK